MPDPLDRLRATLRDRYTLERELGAGGMATVSLAPDHKHDRKVAIKVLRPQLAAVLAELLRHAIPCHVVSVFLILGMASCGSPMRELRGFR